MLIVSEAIFICKTGATSSSVVICNISAAAHNLQLIFFAVKIFKCIHSNITIIWIIMTLLCLKIISISQNISPFLLIWSLKVLRQYFVEGCALCGVLCIALPIPIIVNNFNKFYEKSKIEEEIGLKKNQSSWEEAKRGKNIVLSEKVKKKYKKMIEFSLWCPFTIFFGPKIRKKIFTFLYTPLNGKLLL